MIRVLLADDHPVVRQGLRTFLDLQEDFEVVGEAGDGNEALALVGSLKPDVLLLDMKMPELDGLGVLRALEEDRPRVIVLTSVTSPGEVGPAMRAGASGFLYKDAHPEALVGAIRSVHAGQVSLAPQAATVLATGTPADEAAAPLTDREREVLALIAAGRSNREIARELVVSEKTVKTHVSSLMTKLGVQDRTQAAVWALRNGLVD